MNTIGSVLALLSLVFLGSLMLTCDAVFHLNVSAADSAQKRAHNVAESAIDKTIERLVTDPKFGQPGDQVSVSNGDDVGIVTIGGKTKTASVNNLNGVKSVTAGNGRPVPASSALVIAQGTSGTRNCVVQALVSLPLFPYAIAGAGPLISTGGLIVTADPGADNFGSILSNASGSPSIQIDRPSSVSGNVDSSGTVQLAAGVSVKGTVAEDAQPVTLPLLSAIGYDPAGLAGTHDVSTASGDLSVSSLARSSGPLSLHNLALSDGVLFVAGDLTITGSITGTGAIFSTGNVTIQHAARLQSDDVVALVADGNVTLAGTGPDGSFFQGMVRAGGSFKASDMTIHGVFVQADPSGKTELHNVHVQQNSAWSQVQFGMTAPLQPPAAGGGYQGLSPFASADGSTIGIQLTANTSAYNGFVHVAQGVFQEVVDSSTVGALIDSSGNEWSMGLGIDGAQLAHMVDPATGQYMTRAQLGSPSAYTFTYALYCTLPVDATKDISLSNGVSYGEVEQVSSAIGRAQMAQTFNAISGTTVTLPGPNGTTATVTIPPSILQKLQASLGTSESALLDAVAYRLQQLQQYRTVYEAATGRRDQMVYTVDLNQFIHPEDKVVVLQWGDLSGQ